MYRILGPIPGMASYVSDVGLIPSMVSYVSELGPIPGMASSVSDRPYSQYGFLYLR
jgi:hypothetical protein